jgi:hypothetical protein
MVALHAHIPFVHAATSAHPAWTPTDFTQILGDTQRRADMPGVMWPNPVTGQVTASAQKAERTWLAPDINALPFVDRSYLAQDPHQENGRLEANMVGARGCPCNCSFCGAAASANPDITIRVRDPENILAEMSHLRTAGIWQDRHRGRTGRRTAPARPRRPRHRRAVRRPGWHPRKGVTHTWEDVQAELCDVIFTAMVALTTLTPDARETFDGHLARVASRSLGTPRAAVTS